MYGNKPEEHEGVRTFCMVVYIVTALAGILQCFNDMMILSLILLVIAWFLSKAQKLAAANTPYASHIEWTERTMSIGGGFLFPAALIIAGYLLWKELDIEQFKANIQNDETGDFMPIVQKFIDANTVKIMHITDMSCLPPTLWWVRRCVVGFYRAKDSLPIDYPDSWF